MRCFLGFTESFEGFFALAGVIVGDYFGIGTGRYWHLSCAVGKLKSCRLKIVAAIAVVFKMLVG